MSKFQCYQPISATNLKKQAQHPKLAHPSNLFYFRTVEREAHFHFKEFKLVSVKYSQIVDYIHQQYEQYVLYIISAVKLRYSRRLSELEIGN